MVDGTHPDIRKRVAGIVDTLNLSRVNKIQLKKMGFETKGIDGSIRHCRGKLADLDHTECDKKNCGCGFWYPTAEVDAGLLCSSCRETHPLH